MPRLTTTLESRSTCVTSFIVIISNNYAEKAVRKDDIGLGLGLWLALRSVLGLELRLSLGLRFDNKNMGCV